MRITSYYFTSLYGGSKVLKNLSSKGIIEFM